jgi:predicted phosphohydrolase
MGHDVLMLMDNLMGKAYVIRSTMDGKHISTSKLVPVQDGPKFVQNMINEQNNNDCLTVTGNGQWSAD